ncbi:MAG TPA: BadF/BadG/BcrA/BcrD ATPase family protein [Terriglobia bacterium]|nr:BadF/BadG/BcrA/BcrD ATPase family protein [Terriglobia bacterium]
MNMFLGIDGGGTRTTAWLADEHGNVLGRATSGPSNPLKVGFDACHHEILRAGRGAVRAAVKGGLKPAPSKLDAVVLGLAGTDRPPIHKKLEAWLRKAIPARKHMLTSDAAIALRAAIGDSPGIIVISGTGSIAFAQEEAGRVLRSGGWGALYDDAGSGYDLGRRAIMAALHDQDGRGQKTQLRERICRALELNDISEVVLKPLEPHAIAALFPLVVEAAESLDIVAERLCSQAGRDLADLALALERRLNWTRRIVPVVCAGGVFKSSPAVRHSFAGALRREAPLARVMLLEAEPVEGALALARELVRKPARALAPRRRNR